MKTVITSVVLALAVTACSRPAPQSDEYFESITPQSEAARQSEARLRAAEDRARTLQQNRINNALETAVGDDASGSTETQDTADLIEQAENELALAGDAAPEPEFVPTPQDTSVVSNADDFEAVQETETVRSEAERVAELGKTYKTFDPQSLPARQSSTNLDAFAETNRKRTVGKSRYRRDADSYTSNFCENYIDMELAQVSFLLQGGPKSDPLLLDSDGDGFACSWTPQTHLLAKNRRSASAQ